MKSAREIWGRVGFKVINNIKLFLLQHYIDDILREYQGRIEGLVRTYSRYLPRFVAESETDDLRTLAQLEFLETVKVWDPEKNDAVWPLARTRMIGAMKDHIRYLTKSDPTRMYDWIVDAAHMYQTVSDRGDFENQIETGVQLREAMKVLDARERALVIAHTKQDKTFKEIGEKIGVSESQASRIYKKSLEKLKKVLKD